MADTDKPNGAETPIQTPAPKQKVRISLTINGVHYRVMHKKPWKHVALVRVERPDASKPTEIKIRRVASFKTPADADAFGTYLDVVSQLALRAHKPGRPAEPAAEN